MFDNLKLLLEQNKGKTSEAVREILKGKSIYKNLTTDDLFAFTLQPANYVSGRTRETNFQYRGEIFRLINLTEFPSPQLKYLYSRGNGSGNDSGIGMSEPRISSPGDLVSEFLTTKPPEELWAASYLPIKTIFPPEANDKKYVGFSAECRPSPDRPDSRVCSGFAVIPSPQIH